MLIISYFRYHHCYYILITIQFNPVNESVKLSKQIGLLISAGVNLSIDYELISLRET